MQQGLYTMVIMMYLLVKFPSNNLMQKTKSFKIKRRKTLAERNGHQVWNKLFVHLLSSASLPFYFSLVFGVVPTIKFNSYDGKLPLAFYNSIANLKFLCVMFSLQSVQKLHHIEKCFILMIDFIWTSIQSWQIKMFIYY